MSDSNTILLIFSFSVALLVLGIDLFIWIKSKNKKPVDLHPPGGYDDLGKPLE